MKKIFFSSLFIFISLFLISENVIFEEETESSSDRDETSIFFTEEKKDTSSTKENVNVPVQSVSKEVIGFDLGYNIGKSRMYVDNFRGYLPCAASAGVTTISCIAGIFNPYFLLLSLGGCVASGIIFGKDYYPDEGYSEYFQNDNFKKGYIAGSKQSKMWDSFIKAAIGFVTGPILVGVLYIFFVLVMY